MTYIKRERVAAPTLAHEGGARFSRLLGAAELRAGREVTQDEFNRIAQIPLNISDGDALHVMASILGTSAPRVSFRWTPSHTFNLKTAEGRNARLRQLRLALRVAEREHADLEAAAKAARAFNIELQKRRSSTGDWDLGPQHCDTDKLYRWWRLGSEVRQLNRHIAAMEKANVRRAKQRKQTADRKRARKLYQSRTAREIRNARDRDRYAAGKDARNAKRRAAYAASKAAVKSAGRGSELWAEHQHYKGDDPF